MFTALTMWWLSWNKQYHEGWVMLGAGLDLCTMGLIAFIVDVS